MGSRQTGALFRHRSLLDQSASAHRILTIRARATTRSGSCFHRYRNRRDRNSKKWWAPAVLPHEGVDLRNLRVKPPAIEVLHVDRPPIFLLAEEAEPRIPIVKGYETVDGSLETSIIPTRKRSASNLFASRVVRSCSLLSFSKPFFFDEVPLKTSIPNAVSLQLDRVPQEH